MGYITTMKKVCDSCGGSGQIGHFPGESRFLISWEECDECNGTGLPQNSVDENDVPAPGKPQKTTQDKPANSVSPKKKQ